MLDYLHSIKFANKEALYLLIIPLLLTAYYILRYRQRFPAIMVSTLAGLKTAGSDLRGKLQPLLMVFRVLSLSFLVLAFARPQTHSKEEKITTEGIDIILALDVSSSMLARDFQPNRLEAAKQVASSFVDGRPNDRIGLVVFAGESFTQCPITTDHAVLKNLLDKTKPGMIEDGTAIGMGLAIATNRLKESEAKSKVIILMTDGENNAGYIDPITATDAAVQFGVRVYTIGVGTRGMAPYPFQLGNRTIYQNVQVNIDEDLLKKIADLTGGKYFRATDNESLKKIYDEIDKMEKSKIEVSSIKRTSEEFLPFALLAALFLSLEILLKFTLFRSLP